MSRARNIKPGFFKNDILAELPFEYRILFQGLWCEADREGRLEDRPKRIKAEVFPYDDVDVDSGLNALQLAGFITRYAVGKSQYIQVLEFKKHQNPHCKEAASTIPAHNEHGASTVQAPEIPERAGLIPDSGFLIPDSRDESANADLSPAAPEDDPAAGDGSGEQPQQGRPPCPHERIIAAYHEVLPELRQVREWNETRRRLLGRRWSESHERQSVDWWRKYFGYVRKSDFLMGKTTGRDGRPFDCDLEWLVRPQNFAKVIEGKYE